MHVVDQLQFQYQKNDVSVRQKIQVLRFNVEALHLENGIV